MNAPWQDANFAQLSVRLNPHLVQWVNRASQLEPRKRKGGWFVERSFESEPLHIGDPSAVTFYPNNGNEPAEGYYYDAITIAPLADRFMWLDNIDRGWTQILGLAQDGETLVKLTGKGLTSRAYNRAVKNHNKWIARATDGQAPGWAFWMVLTAGDVQQFDQGGVVTHVDHHTGSDLRSAYIGDDAVRHVNSLADGVRLWALEWSDNDTTADARMRPREGDAGDNADADGESSSSVSDPPPRENRYSNGSGGNRGSRQQNDAAVGRAGADARMRPREGDAGTETSDTDLPTETLQHLLARGGENGITRFRNALGLTLPDDAGPEDVVRRVVAERSDAPWWADVRDAAKLANAWMRKFHAARETPNALAEMCDHFKIEDAKPGHMAAVIALAWLMLDEEYREKIQERIDTWATSLTNQTS